MITLGIIGVVAAMTIPTLMNQTNDKQTVVALKKAYTTLSQAYTLAVNENGTPDNWDLVVAQDPQGNKNVLNMLGTYMKFSKSCGTDSGCIPDVIKKESNAAIATNFNTSNLIAKAQLNDGTWLWAQSYGVCSAVAPTINACAEVVIDTNGLKTPNKFGDDIFGFYITTTGIVPWGGPQDTSAGTSFNGKCKDNTSASGYGCTAWVIYNENLDYKKCSDLDWNTKTKCN